MKFDSPIFDRIRVSSRGRPNDGRSGGSLGARGEQPACDWPGCAASATHRAPKGRLREGQYWRFCLEHVREYNHSYNYFAGMSDDAVARYQKEAVTGHRPTWRLGLNGRFAGATAGRHAYADFVRVGDPFDLFPDGGGRAGFADGRAGRVRRDDRLIPNAERRALDLLGLEGGAAAPDIKARFKLLVKRHHPDANGGDRTSEDRLREIIQAYNYLKSAGRC
jgi:hypothetical protein